jgi:carboxymethylenebutenolidase
MSSPNLEKGVARINKGNSKTGVVVVHEIFGLDDYARGVARTLASSGFWSVAQDYFRGERPSSLEEGMKLRSSLEEEDIVNATNLAVQELRKQIGSGAKIGTLGFCMGGGFALLSACKLNLDFCVDYYGAMENSDLLDGGKFPILLILGSEDPRVTPWAYSSFMPAATKYKRRVTVELYPNAAHAFHRPGWNGHNKVAADDAWKRTIDFLSALK